MANTFDISPLLNLKGVKHQRRVEGMLSDDIVFEGPVTEDILAGIRRDMLEGEVQTLAHEGHPLFQVILKQCHTKRHPKWRMPRCELTFRIVGPAW